MAERAGWKREKVRETKREERKGLSVDVREKVRAERERERERERAGERESWREREGGRTLQKLNRATDMESFELLNNTRPDIFLQRKIFLKKNRFVVFPSLVELFQPKMKSQFDGSLSLSHSLSLFLSLSLSSH